MRLNWDPDTGEGAGAMGWGGVPMPEKGGEKNTSWKPIRQQLSERAPAVTKGSFSNP